MSIKLVFLICLVLLFIPFSMSRDGFKKYYLLTVVMFVVRELNIEPFGDIVPAAVMTTVLFLAVFIRRPQILKGWALYVGYLLFSLILGLLGESTVTKALFWVFTLYTVMGLAIIPQYIFNNERDLKQLATCIIVVSFLLAITALISYWGYADGVILMNMAPENLSDIHNSRIYGITFSNLSQIIPIISICLLPELHIKKRWIEYIIIAIFIFSGLITIKRMTFIAIVASLTYYIYVQCKRKQFLTIGIIVSLTIFMVSVFWDALSYRFGVIGFGENDIVDHSAISRLYRISLAEAAFDKSPIFGMGAGYVIYVHNGLMEILGNCGILGVFAIFLRLFPPLKAIKKLNPWAIAALIYIATCFTLESAINNIQIISFLGMYLGGYYVSKKLNIQY